MASNIGTKIVLGGEKDFRSAVSAINQQMKGLQSAAALTAEQYRENDKSLEALTHVTQNYEKEAEAHKKNIDKLNESLEAAKKLYGEDSQIVQKWQTELNKEQAALIKTERAIKDNNEQIAKMTSVTGKVKGAIDDWKKKVEDLKDKHETLYKGIKKVGDVAGSVAKGGLKVLGAAGGAAVAGVAAVGAAASKAAKELTEMIKATAEAGDKIDKGSQKIGVSAEKYQVLSYQARMSGTSIETITKAASKLKSAGSDLSVDQAIKKIASIQDPSKRSAAAVEMFGAKVAQELTPMLNAGTEGLRDMEKAARDNGLVMSNEAVSASVSFNDSMETLQSTISAVKNGLVSELLPGATDVVQGITGLFSGKEGATEQIKKGLDDMVSNLKEIIPRGMEILETLIGAVIEIAPDIIISLADGIIDNLDTILDSAIEVIEALTTGLLNEENITKIMNAGIGVVTKLVGFISENVDLLVDSAFDIIMALVNAFSDKEQSEKLIEGAISIVVGVASGIIENTAELAPAAFEMAESIVVALLNYDWSSAGKDIMGAIITGIPVVDFVSNLVSYIKNPDEFANKVLYSVLKREQRRLQKESETNTTKPAPKTQNRHKTGLDYVPYDGYLAELHEGERVLTKAEAHTYSESGSDTVAEVRSLRRELAGMREDIRRYGMPVDVRNADQLGRKIGRAVHA